MPLWAFVLFTVAYGIGCFVWFGLMLGYWTVTPGPFASDEDEHDPLCAEGTWAGDQRMPCDCRPGRAK